MGDLLGPRINTYDAARSAHAACHFHRQRPCATAYIQHLLSSLHAGQVESPLPELPQCSTERKGVVEPSHQVVAPAPLEDQPLCLFGLREAFIAVAVTCK